MLANCSCYVIARGLAAKRQRCFHLPHCAYNLLYIEGQRALERITRTASCKCASLFLHLCICMQAVFRQKGGSFNSLGYWLRPHCPSLLSRIDGVIVFTPFRCPFLASSHNGPLVPVQLPMLTSQLLWLSKRALLGITSLVYELSYPTLSTYTNEKD